MILRFCSGSVTPGQLAEEALARVDDAQVGLERVAKQRLDLGRLARALQAVVDEDAGEPRPDRAQHQRRRHRRVDAAREAADGARRRADLRGAPPRPPRRRSRPSSSSARSRRCGTGSWPGSRRRAACAPPRGGTARPRTCAPGAATAAAGQLALSPTTSKPAGSASTRSPWLIQTGISSPAAKPWNSSPGAGDLARWRARTRAARPATTLPPERQRRQLHAVADAEDRDAQLVDLGRDARRVRVVAGRRPAREDDPARRELADARHRQVERVDLGVDVLLAHPARDELRVLRAEVEDEDRGRAAVPPSLRYCSTGSWALPW